MDSCSITLELNPTDGDVQAVVCGLVQFNTSCVEAENWQRLVLLLRDSEDSLQGGLLGYTHWQWLFVSHLWIAEPVRGRGYGQSLIVRAEEEAIHRGCGHAHLDTFDFQARGFYEGLGYMVFGQLAGFPPGHTRYFLCKELLSSAHVV
jgi:GNAT superfamily N-acetyltransferase